MTDSLLPTTPTELPLRPQDEVECRRCEVHCDKVVYPGACIERACAFVYAYEAFGHTVHGFPFALRIRLPPLAGVFLRRKG